MQKNWFVVYTKPRHEKKAAAILEKSEVDVYLPLKKQLKVWSDRRKWVEEPLFSGYLFVNIEEKEYIKVLNSFGIVRFITFSSKPAIVRDSVISYIKQLTNSDITTDLEVDDSSFIVGEEVSIQKGPLKGIKGKLVSIKGKTKIAVEIECMQKAVLVEIDKSYLI